MPLRRTLNTDMLRRHAYQLLLRGLFTIDPEKVHHLIFAGLRTAQRVPLICHAIRPLFAADDPVLQQHVFGVDFPRPLGLAAGFDKDATAVDVWDSFGFGFAELGTLTSEGQPGNPTPRLFRLKADHGLLNRMGFNNNGAVAAAQRIARRHGHGVIGINIGKQKVVPADEAAADYQRAARLLAHHADYLVLNVSSPNTPGLRDLQAVESLRPIIEAVQTETDETPVLVKIAPDLSDEDVRAVAHLALELHLAGIIATNTTISRAGLSTSEDEVAALGAGGVSGRPVASRALEVLRILRAEVGDELTLIGVGGIENAPQAWERIGAGASLLQGYTPLIYGGPDWIRDIHRGLAEQVRRHGLTNISEAVGRELPWKE